MNAFTYVLLHGAWHDAWCWHLVKPLLEQAGHRVLAPDLPGHGVNTFPVDRISLNVYSRYISNLIDNYNNIVLVGHSMAGAVITRVAAEKKHDIALLVYLNAYVPGPGQSIFDLMEVMNARGMDSAISQALEMSEDKRLCWIRDSDRLRLFYSQTENDIANTACSRFTSQATLALAGRQPDKDDMDPDCVPAVYIGAPDDLVLPLPHQQFMLQQRPFLAHYQLNGDHSPFLSCPQALTDLLLKQPA